MLSRSALSQDRTAHLPESSSFRNGGFPAFYHIIYVSLFQKKVLRFQMIDSTCAWRIHRNHSVDSAGHREIVYNNEKPKGYLIMNEKKVRSHPFCEKHPVLAMILFSVGGSILISLIGGLFAGILGFVMDSGAADYFGTSIAAVAVLGIYTLWFSPQFKGEIRSGLSRKWTLILMIPGIMYTIYVLVSQLIQYKFFFKPSLLYFAMACAAGFGEEIMFRGLAIPIGMGFIRSEKRVWLVPICTAALFGLFHLGNIFAGASVSNSIVQAIGAGLHGFYYGIILSATGSILPSILIHMVYDFVCFAGDPTLDNGIMAGQLSTFAVVESIVTSIIVAGVAVILMRKLGDRKILDVWKRKWSQISSAKGSAVSDKAEKPEEKTDASASTAA